nr:hypothetical protein [Tanacetum cinerariifolium]
MCQRIQGSTHQVRNYTRTFEKEAQARVITDCHAGNPCDLELDPTAMSRDQKKDPEGFGAINKAIQLRICKTQQVAARDEKWVSSAERVKISSTNIKLETTMPQKEETFQVVIDITKNSTCFKAFSIFADILEIFRQQFLYSIKKLQGTVSYEFLLANKKYTVNVDVFRMILDICPRVEGVDFRDVLDDDTALSFLIDLGYKGSLNKHTNMFVDHMHQPWRTLAAIINKCLSGKLANNLDVILKLAKSISKTEAEEAEAARKLHDTHARIMTEFVPESAKKKSCGRIFRRSCRHLQDLKESKKFDKRQPGTGGSSEGTGSIPGVLKESTGDEDDDNDDVEKDDKDSDADDEGDDHVSDTQDADDEDDEIKSDEDDIYKYKIRVRKDVDVEMKDAKVEESDKGDEEVTNAAKEEAEKTSEAKDDTKKTELPPSSSSLSASLGTPIISSVQQTPTPIPTPPITTDAPTITTAVLESNALITVELRVAKLEIDVSELKTADHSTKALAILKIKKEQAQKQKKPQFTIKSTDKAALEEYDLKSALYQCMHANKSFNRNPANHNLYHALMEALIEDENAMDKGVADTVKDHKRKHDDDEDDDDEYPLARPNQGKTTKRRRTKESESLGKPSSTKEIPKGKALTKGSKTSKSASAKEPVEEPIAEVIMDDADDDVIENLTQDILLGHAFNLLKGDRYPFDLSKPLPLQVPPGHRTVAVDYFFNNDLEYLKTSDSEVNKFSKHNVYSNKAILGVKSVTVKKLHGYGHLEEIVVKRYDQQLHKFKEGDFVDLHLKDIKDMLLLVVQDKLFHLDDSDIVDFIMALPERKGNHKKSRAIGWCKGTRDGLQTDDAYNMNVSSQNDYQEDSEIVKAKVKRKSLALKAKKESSDEECLTSGCEDEEYATAVRDFKKFCKRRDKNQRAFVGVSWSDSGEKDDEKVKNETCLVAQGSSEVCSESFYFSDENSSIDDLALDNKYDKLCKMILKIITKNKRLKATRNNLEKEISILKEKVSTLEENKEVDLECVKCLVLKIKNEKLKEEALKLTKFEKSIHCLSEMLNNQKPSGEKLGLGFNSFEASSSGTKEIKFMKAQKKMNDKYKTDEGYHVVPPPYTRNFMPPKPDLILVNVDEYVVSETVTSVPAVAKNEAKTSESKPKSVSEPIIEDRVFDSEDEDETETKSKQRKPSFAKYICKHNKGQLNGQRMVRSVWNNTRKLNHQNSLRMSNPHPKWNFVPSTVLMRSGFKTLNTVRKNSSRAVVSVNTAKQINTDCPRPTVNCARPVSNIFNKTHSHDKSPINNRTTSKNSKINQKVNIVRAKYVNTVRPKVNTARPKAVLNAIQGNQEFDRGYVTFGGRAKGGKITGKGTLKTDGSLFNSSSKNASNDEPQPYSDAGKKDDEGVKNADFEKIVNFLNANPIRYAFVSPTIYVSYSEQFWSTAKTKTINNETQIRAKVDGKTIVITEPSVRRDLQFNDEDGIAC